MTGTAAFPFTSRKAPGGKSVFILEYELSEMEIDEFRVAPSRVPRDLARTLSADLFLLAHVLGHSHQRVTELDAHLLPDHLARARNAVNLGPTLQTVAAIVAIETETAKAPQKTDKRH